MYISHFGLRQRPFRATPDPATYYPATTHEDALHVLQQALTDEDAVALLIGEPGTGKTLLAAMLVERLTGQASCVVLNNGHLRRPADLLQAVLYDLGLPHDGGEQDLRLRLTDCLLTRFAEGQRTVVLVDEAHHLPPDVLEELRLLGNLETRLGKAVQTVLIALPEIGDTLHLPDLRALRQRLTARATLGRLPPDEAADYLLNQLRGAGARPEAIMTDEAVGIIARAAGGLPRVLNQVGHLALSLTHQAGEGRVDTEGALEACARLGLEAAEDSVVPESASGEANGSVPEEAFLLPPSGSTARLMYRPGLSG